MTTNDFVALAEALRAHNGKADGRTEFTPDHLRVLADFCASQEPNFNRKRWIDYIAGECGQADERMLVEPGSPPVPRSKASRQIVTENGPASRRNSIEREGKAQ